MLLALKEKHVFVMIIVLGFLSVFSLTIYLSAHREFERNSAKSTVFNLFESEIRDGSKSRNRNATSHVIEARNRNNATSHVIEALKVNQFRQGTLRNFDYENMLALRASPDNIVILAMTDFSYVDMAINLYEASFKPHDITNFLFVGTGSRSCEVLVNHSLPCFRYADDNESEVANIFQSSGFKRKMNIRTNMILAALRAGFSVLHMDVDVVFLKNPLEELKVR